MWKVVVTEIQDANALEPLNVPPGAFFVSTERFARTVENLDLQALINTVNRMQSLKGHRREKRPVPGEKALRQSSHRTQIAAVKRVASV
jgi:hypothetical protein